MFQYAAARRLAEVHGTDLKIDLSRLLNSNPLDTPRDYALGCFAISAEIASASESQLCEKLHRQAASPMYRLLQKFRIAPHTRGNRTMSGSRGRPSTRDSAAARQCLPGWLLAIGEIFPRHQGSSQKRIYPASPPGR